MTPPTPDEAVTERFRLTPTQMGALGSMPVILTPEGYLPPFSPRSDSIAVLARKGLVELTDTDWRRTSLGQAVWDRR